MAFGEFEEVYEDHCITSLYIVGKGIHKHLQMVAKGISSSLPILNQKTRWLKGGIKFHLQGMLILARS